MTSFTPKICIGTSFTWRLMLEEKMDSFTVGEMLKYQKMYRDEMEELFRRMDWNEQIEVAVGSQDSIWVALLDSEQYAAYQLMKD